MSYFETAKHDIDELTFTSNVDPNESAGRLRRFRKLLYLSIIDSLARSVYPNKDGNRDRITAFVKKFCGWSDSERVSFSHLREYISKRPEPEFAGLRHWIAEHARNWESEAEESISCDPDLVDIRRKWPTDRDSIRADVPSAQYSRILPEALTHLSLLYQYRNTLVHEFRSPGHATEYVDDENRAVAFYHGRLDLSTDSQTWELCYPIGLFKLLCDSAIANLRTYFLETGVNPYESYNFGTYFLSPLND